MRRLAAIPLAMVCACYGHPPAPPAPRDAVAVSASFGKTWDAAIDAFADHGISVETLDRSSGFIVPAGRSRVANNPEEALKYADCGRSAIGEQHYPLAVKYNVLIRGDSARSTVQVRAFYTSEKGESCSSTGFWEDFVETGVKARAEGKPEQ
jgi:hypothetical protein